MKMRFYLLSKLLYTGIALMMLFSSCDIINPEEDIPAYVAVNNVEFNTNILTEGSSSNRITEVWMSVNGNFLGAYTLPSPAIPILEAGETELAFQAGIKDNGINATPEIYPFYTIYTTTVNLDTATTREIQPVFEYREDTKFAFIEDFQDGSQIFKDIVLGREEQIRLVSEGSFEGGSSALITLDTSSTIFEAATISRYSNLVSNTSATVYLEVNYKSDVPVIFGVRGYQQGAPATAGRTTLDPAFLPSENWNKIYFNLSLMISQLRLDEYQVVFRAFIPSQGGELTRDSANVWLDNIKLVHF